MAIFNSYMLIYQKVNLHTYELYMFMFLKYFLKTDVDIFRGVCVFFYISCIVVFFQAGDSEKVAAKAQNGFSKKRHGLLHLARTCGSGFNCRSMIHLSI